VSTSYSKWNITCYSQTDYSDKNCPNWSSLYHPSLKECIYYYFVIIFSNGLISRHFLSVLCVSHVEKSLGNKNFPCLCCTVLLLIIICLCVWNKKNMSKPMSKKMSLPTLHPYIIIKSINNNISTAFLPHTSIIESLFLFQSHLLVWKKMSQVHIFIVDSHSLYLSLHHPKYHFPKLIILQIPHTGVLPINCKKFYAYFMKKIKLRFHAFPVLIARVIIPAICKMGSQK